MAEGPTLIKPSQPPVSRSKLPAQLLEKSSTEHTSGQQQQQFVLLLHDEGTSYVHINRSTLPLSAFSAPASALERVHRPNACANEIPPDHHAHCN